MQRLTYHIRNERGGGLLMALLILVALVALGAGIVAQVSNDRRITSYNMTRSRALNYAEAGVAEAIERIRSGDVPDNQNPKTVSQIFLTTQGDVPIVGTDTVAMATKQPAGAWLPYSSDTKSSDVLTVQYMTDAARTGIYYYDKSKTPAIQGKSGEPVFLIHSVSHIGQTRKQIDATVAQIKIKPNLLGAYIGGSDVKFHGAEIAIGYDYVAATPSGTGSAGARVNTYESGGPNSPAVWSAGQVNITSPSKAIGSPNTLASQSGFYAGPWAALGMAQSEFYDWIGPPLSVPKGGASVMPNGITYLGDPNSAPQKAKQQFKIKGGNGDGILYVDGDLELSGDFTFRGLIYVEGTLTMKGNGWVLGAIVVADKSNIKTSHKNSLTVLKSNEAVSDAVKFRGAPFVTINWRES